MKLLRFLWPEVAVNTTAYPAKLWPLPGGITPDNVGMYGLFGLGANANQNQNAVQPVTSGTSVTVTLTAAQFNAGIIDHSGNPGGGVTVTTPTAAQIIAALPATIPQDGTYVADIYYQNDGLGQTVTLNGGTGVTILGNNTMANNTCRKFAAYINPGAGTVTMLNLFTANL